MKVIPVYADKAISGKALSNLLLRREIPVHLFREKKNLFQWLHIESADILILDFSSLNFVRREEIKDICLVSPSLSFIILSPYRAHEVKLAQCQEEQYYLFEKPVEIEELFKLIISLNK